MAELRTLELYGFKSFARKTSLTFDPGITAIVGPNGSGKSNIVDAVRWVLGEQSARELRGTRMEDIIFAGSEQRRPLGVAQVSLTLDDPGAELGLDYNEITLTRRVDRSGASDYLVNRSPWRLKDLRELLFGTGLGRNSYALISQGEIDEIVLSSPEDLRLLFEEAAAITRFKSRQRQALRNLEDVRERRSRLEIMVEELERRLGPLQEAAKRAKQHAELKQQLEEQELLLNISTYSQAHRHLEEQQEVVEGLKERLEELDSERESATKELGQTRQAFERAGAGLEQVRRKLQEANRERERLQNELSLAQERVQQKKRDAERLGNQLDALTERLERWEATQEERREELETYRAEAAAAKQALAADRAREKELAAKHEKLQARRGELEQKLASAEAELERLESVVQKRKEQFDRATDQHEKLEQRQRELAAEQNRCEKELEELEQEVQEGSAREEKLCGKLETARAELEELRRRRGDAADLVSGLTSEFNRVDTRLSTLREVETNYEGYYRGVRAVLRARDEEHQATSGIVGAVSELLTVSTEYEEALEIALGSRLQNIVTVDGAAAQRAVEFLKSERAGRATFLPLATLTYRKPRQLPEAVEANPAVLGWAAELVECEERFTPVVEYLLGRTLVVSSLEAARELHAGPLPRVRKVTLEGELLRPGGSITGGRSKSGRAGSGLLARQQELQELSQRHDRLQGELEEAKEELVSVEGQLSEARPQVQDLESRHAAVHRELTESREQLESARQRHTELESERDELSGELESLAESVQQARQEYDESSKDASESEEEVAGLRGSLEQLTAELSELEQEQSQLRANMNTQEELISDREVQLERLKKWLDQEAEHRTELHEELAQTKTSLQEAEEQAASWEQKVEEVSASLEDLEERRRVLEEAREDRQQKRKELAEQVVALERSRDNLQETHERITSTLHNAELQLARWEMRLESAEEDLRSNGDHPPDSTELDSMQLLESEERLEEVEKEVKQLKRRLARLEPVNTSAVEEHREVRERYERLYSHWHELERGESALQRLSKKLDEAMERRFYATLEEVRNEFVDVFQLLFEGGTVDLVLTGEGTIWDRGIDVIAQPPGKKLQSLSLLSGGEKALTAISLLFAFIRCNPAPFVILDEIDTALDQTNLDRFARFLDEAADTNQFVLVTHQKRTMEEADVLYGVTMTGDGTSRIVSVKLSAAEELVAQG